MKISNALSQRRLFSRDQGELPPFLSELFQTLPAEVVQPETSKEVIDIVRVASRSATPVVARGAGSTAFGQVIPVMGGMVLDLNFLKSVRRLDRGRREVTVEAGARWSDLDAWLEDRGFGLGSYPSSWYSTVGGWVATGGYGIGSLKCGHLKEQVTELWVCSHDGRDERFKAGTPGFEAFFGTEGQMGVVLEVTLRVRPRATQHPVLLEAPGLEKAWEALRGALSQSFDLFHASVYGRERMAHFDRTLAERMLKKGAAVPAVRFGDSAGVLLALETAADVARLKDWASRAGIRAAPDFKAAFAWNERFYPLRGKAADKMFLGNEVLIGNSKAAAYCADLERLADAAGLELAVEGESAGKEQSLVLASFLAPAADPAAYARGLAAVFKMDRLGTSRHGGTLYHVGIYNTPFLSRKFDAGKLKALREAKARFDPRGLFNPGKFFEMKTAKTPKLPSWLQVSGARVLIAAIQLPGLGAALTALAGRWIGTLPGRTADRVMNTARECVNCGFCLPVCPAYLATKDERTTARGKLFLAQSWLQGGALSDEDVRLLNSCMHCGGCTAVCQSALDLVPAWDELESRVNREHGKPAAAIASFVKDVEESADYKRLLRKGTITEYRTSA